MQKTNTKVAVIGLGKSGFQSAVFLKRRGYRVFAADQQVSEALTAQAGLLTEQGIEVQLGQDCKQELLSCDWVLISPGIKPANDIVVWLREAGKPIFSEIEVAAWFCDSKNIIAVTGSCGKTTLVTLLTQLLEKAGKKVVCCGNIGNPWIGELDKIDSQTFVVLELSSFQLNNCYDFHPHLALLTNIFPNHLDWHPDMEDYIQSKLKMFSRQTASDFAVIREEDLRQNRLDSRMKAKLLSVKEGEPNPHLSMLKLASQALHLPSGLAQEVFDAFAGLEHRMEKLGDLNGIQFINDSKSTTTASLKWALEKFSDKSVYLIAGGIAKSKDFGDIQDLVAARCKKVILIGRDKELLAEAWENASLVKVKDLDEALSLAFSEAGPGDSVLLSPACASFDQFSDYIDRGNCFKRAVAALKSSNKLLR